MEEEEEESWNLCHRRIHTALVEVNIQFKECSTGNKLGVVKMVDRDLVRLNRCTDEYMNAALNFVEMANQNTGYLGKILCPCKHYHLEPFDEARDEVFAKALGDAETPLYPGCEKYTKLSAIVTLYKIKAENEWTDESFTILLGKLQDMFPMDNTMLCSVRAVKKFLKKFELGYEKIHACVKDCCLFRKENVELENCPKCGSSRWKVDVCTKKIKKGVPAKVLRYFPIIPRFRNMYRSFEVAKDLTWRSTHRSIDAKMRHSVDSSTWKTIDDKWPSFSSDPRNLRLGLATDGFNPFRNLSSTYSCWPVMLVMYNLPPWLWMKKENVLLTLLIPGPKQSGNDIDVYLRPLIEDLQILWTNGAPVYDRFTNSTFNLRAILMWTMHDFPAYGNVAGCTTKGKFACPICGENTHFLWLKFSRKTVYLCHRCFLPPSHPFRKKKSWFDGKEEKGKKPRIMIGKQISETLKDVKNDWGKGGEGNKKRKRDSEDKQRWKKRSILFDLSYWEHDLHPEDRGSRTYLPPASFTLSKDDKRIFCKRLFDLKVPDGYSSNIGNCVSMDELKVTGLKSHDCHVLMLQLFPVALKGLLPTGPRNAIFRLCAFFNRLCQRVIDQEEMASLEDEVVETLCTLERHMKIYKQSVGNHARPEGCIAERFLVEECITFCSRHMKSMETTNMGPHNQDFESDVILEGRPISAATSNTLTDEVLESAHRYVLFNTAIVEPYLEMHIEELKNSDASLGLQKNKNLLLKRHTDNFSKWLREKVKPCTNNELEILHWLANGPRKHAMSYTGYIINGQWFHTKEAKKSTQNSGVSIDAATLCRSSVKDNAQVIDVVSYYGVIKDIILLHYHTFQLPLFKCDWANIGHSVRLEDGFTLVNLHQGQTQYDKDPFILASQAKQVYYSRETESSNWYVVLKAPPRGFYDLETYEETVDTSSRTQDVSALGYERLRQKKMEQNLAKLKVAEIKNVPKFLLGLNQSANGKVNDKEEVDIGRAVDGDNDFVNGIDSRKKKACSSAQPLRKSQRTQEQGGSTQGETQVEQLPTSLTEQTDMFCSPHTVVGYNVTKSKRKRGPTKLKTIAIDGSSRIEVKFDENGEPIGEGSVKLSSFLGPLVREIVPCTLSNWRKLPSGMAEILWQSIKGIGSIFMKKGIELHDRIS
ncbi:hypothetical protein RHSIM_Rhsim01G0163400 [Rhododendron simsii]|uniref:Transposase n=1 Tax=Rhododendron simsii TaxID=118357 RepID=A0A834HGT5_RHOSS|nr:hypothetical protein RHSIM_Rhsim01G0163400 [Rhododendron simsii]